MSVRGIALAGAGALAMLVVAGCQREADRPARADAQAAADAPGTTTAAGSRTDAASRAPAPTFADGKPMWAASRRRSAEEGAQRQFDRNGAQFAAGSLQAYVAKAHAFVDSPPKGALTATRANGDTLIYDPRGNVFAVADRQGAPRTLFKPRDGRAYWDQQKQRLADAGRGRSRGSPSSAEGDSNG